MRRVLPISTKICIDSKNPELKKQILERIISIFIICFICWISLFGETIQRQYKNFTLIGLVFFSAASILYKKPRKLSLLDISVYLYFFFATIGIFFSENKSISLEWYRRYILAFPVIYLVTKNIAKRYVFCITLSVFIFSAIIAIIGISELTLRRNIIYEFWINNPFYYEFVYNKRGIMSTLEHPTIFGTFLLGCLPFYYHLLSQIKKTYNIAVKILILICMLGIIFSFSRGNLVGLLGASLSYVLLTKRFRYVKFIFIGILILIVFSSTILIKNFNFKRYSLSQLYPWWYFKFYRSYVALKMVKDHPFVGIGLNHYRLKFEQYSQYGLSFSKKRMPMIGERIKTGFRANQSIIPDNMFFSILSETGLFGFSAFLLFLFLLIKKSFVSLRAVEDIRIKGFFISALCGLIGLLVSMNTYDMLYWINPFLLFWFLAGILASIET